MSKVRSFASLAIGGAGLLLALGSANAVPAYPSVGADTLGPALIITLNPGGTGTVTNGPGFAQGPYDGVEDTYIGLENNSGQAVSAITLSGAGIFGFDSDGIASPDLPGGQYSGSGIQQYGTNNAQDPTGYGGPAGHFNIVDFNNGTFILNSPLAAGGFTWFSLEEPLNSASFTVTGVSQTPVPAALPLFASGAAVLGFFGRRKRKAAKA